MRAGLAARRRAEAGFVNDDGEVPDQRDDVKDFYPNRLQAAGIAAHGAAGSETQVEDVVFLLNRYFAVMGQGIESSGGRVDKFIGDGIMALFGIDGDPAKASRHALAAAFRMSGRIDDLNRTFADDLPRPLRIGIGIHFGNVVLGEMGGGRATSLTAIGDCVNTASRLESLSKSYDAELIVSEDAERHSQLDLSPWPVHEVTVQGRSTPMKIRAFSRARELARPADRALLATAERFAFAGAMVDRAGFEPAYALAGRFTVCCH